MCCYNCEKPGHRLENCEESPTRTCCKSDEHQLANCQFVLYSANVDNKPKEQSEEEKKMRRLNTRRNLRKQKNSVQRLKNKMSKCK